ncbi:tetratricopeptide repeat protein [Bradyrhizobium sp.]
MMVTAAVDQNLRGGAQAIDGFGRPKFAPLFPPAFGKFRFSTARSGKKRANLRVGRNNARAKLLSGDALVLAHYDRAVASAQRGRLGKALAEFDQVIRLDPKFSLAHSDRGLVLTELGRLEEALDELNLAIELDPEMAFLYRNRGWALNKLDRFEGAVKDFTRSIDLGFGNADVYCNRGLTFTRLGRHEEALGDFDDAIRLDPTYAVAHVDRGITLGLLLGRLDEAFEAFSRAIQHDAKLSMAYAGRGWTRAVPGHYIEAQDDVTRAIELDPENAAAHFIQGTILAKLERFDAAINALNDSIRFDPKFADAYCLRGGLLIKLQRYDDAVTDFDRCIDLIGDDASASNALNTMALMLRDAARDLRSGIIPKIAELESNYRVGIVQNFHIESGAADRDNTNRTGKTGEKDEGLVQEPQCDVADTANTTGRFGAPSAEIEITRRSEGSLSETELAEFRAHAAANKWDSSSGVAPSTHIKTTFAKWLGRGLSRQDIVKVQSNLAGAYATEVSRDPSKRVEGLAVVDRKLPPGAPRPPSARPIAELTEAEKVVRRKRKAEAQKRWRLGLQSSAGAPNLARAGAVKVSRDLTQRVDDLVTGDRKLLPPGAPRAPSKRPIAELTEAEKVVRRGRNAELQKRWQRERQGSVGAPKT